MSLSEHKSFTAAIVGGTGYVGAELTRLLLGHPQLTLTHVTARSEAGQPISKRWPHLGGATDLIFCDDTPAELAQKVDVLFLALPHGASMAAVASLFDEAGQPVGPARVVDMSGDFRLGDAGSYAKHYKKPHECPELLDKFVYGLTEWHGARVAESTHVANPGCFATAIGLALAPLAHHGELPQRVTVFAATGSTGSGHRPLQGTHHPERATNFKLYKVLAHQHVPEIQGLLGSLGQETKLSFIPASAPMTHGIFATCHLETERPEALAAIIRESYERAHFVRVRQGSPQTNHVVGANYADIGLFPGDGELVVACTIDNMVKGAAGQAIQNANLMLGLPEASGLGALPSLP